MTREINSPEDQEFREELRSWLAEHLPKGWGTKDFRLPRDRDERNEWLRRWQAEMAEDRWVGIHWPEEFGGRNATLTQQIVYHTEMAEHRMPAMIGRRGLNMTGPTLIVHGTPEQKERFLERIRFAEDLWCTGFSEPDAGSDLAGLRTRGELDGDSIVINGRKIWTSGAHYGDLLYTLVRTDSTGDKHDGITCVVVPLAAEGVDVQPIRRNTGTSEFNEITFDDVRVPVANAIGEIGDGWRVARTSLAHEHYTHFVPSQMNFARTLEEIIRLAKSTDDVSGRPRSELPWLRERIARAWVATRLIRINGMRNIANIVESGVPGPEGSIMKLFGQEEEKKLYELALDVAGERGIFDRGAPLAADRGKWGFGYLGSRAATIGGGTSEMQRNTIAERVLGLPHDP